MIYGDSTSLSHDARTLSWALQRPFLGVYNSGWAEQCYGLVNRPDGGLMSDVVGPDGVTAEWLTKVFAAEGVLRSGSVVSCAVEPLAAMTAHRGAFWDLLFKRQIRALIDNGAFGS